MPDYDIAPALIAHADQHMSAVGDDLDTCIRSYLTHRGQTDPTVAYIVLLDNIREVLTFDQACDTLALAVHRLAEQDAAVTPPATREDQ